MSSIENSKDRCRILENDINARMENPPSEGIREHGDRMRQQQAWTEVENFWR
jgi:hypothetical protein